MSPLAGLEKKSPRFPPLAQRATHVAPWRAEKKVTANQAAGEMREEGFEPSTYALKVRCSTN
jgi:hypothetical protein